jgi:hypothetical protein
MQCKRHSKKGRDDEKGHTIKMKRDKQRHGKKRKMQEEIKQNKT